jgi:hypothetical protein
MSKHMNALQYVHWRSKQPHTETQSPPWLLYVTKLTFGSNLPIIVYTHISLANRKKHIYGTTILEGR